MSRNQSNPKKQIPMVSISIISACRRGASFGHILMALGIFTWTASVSAQTPEYASVRLLRGGIEVKSTGKSIFGGPYTVQEGETSQSISRQFYGTEKNANLLMQINRMLPNSPLEVGRVIRIGVTAFFLKFTPSKAVEHHEQIQAFLTEDGTGAKYAIAMLGDKKGVIQDRKLVSSEFMPEFLILTSIVDKNRKLALSLPRVSILALFDGNVNIIDVMAHSEAIAASKRDYTIQMGKSSIKQHIVADVLSKSLKKALKGSDINERLSGWSKAERLKKQGKKSMDNKQYTSAIKYFQDAREIYGQVGDKVGEALMLERIGFAKLYLENLVEAETAISRALDIAQTIENVHLEILIMIDMGLIKNMYSQFADAIDTYRDALQLLDKHSTPDGRLRTAPWKSPPGGFGISTGLKELDTHLTRAKIFQNIGNALCGLGRYDEAFEYFVRAEEVAPPGSDWKSSPGPKC